MSEFEKGQYNVLCDRCGFKFKARHLRRQWDGVMACSGPSTNDCWEPRHPQDFVRGKPDRQAPEWVRPEPDDVFVTPGPIDPDDY